MSIATRLRHRLILLLAGRSTVVVNAQIAGTLVVTGSGGLIAGNRLEPDEIVH